MAPPFLASFVERGLAPSLASALSHSAVSDRFTSFFSNPLQKEKACPVFEYPAQSICASCCASFSRLISSSGRDPDRLDGDLEAQDVAVDPIPHGAAPEAVTTIDETIVALDRP